MHINYVYIDLEIPPSAKVGLQIQLTKKATLTCPARFHRRRAQVELHLELGEAKLKHEKTN